MRFKTFEFDYLLHHNESAVLEYNKYLHAKDIVAITFNLPNTEVWLWKMLPLLKRQGVVRALNLVVIHELIHILAPNWSEESVLAAQEALLR